MKNSTVFLCLALVFSISSFSPAQTILEEPEHLDKIIALEKRIESGSIHRGDGIQWPVAHPDTNLEWGENFSLYDGNAGIILFYAEAGKVLNNKAYLAKAKAGAKQIMAGIEDIKEGSLYAGLTGIAYVMSEVATITGDQYYQDCYEQLIGIIYEMAANESLINTNANDIISGWAGTGMFFLYVWEKYNDEKALEVAKKSAHFLKMSRELAQGGLRWLPWVASQIYMPNFAHGTSGIAYFFARIYEVTGDEEYLSLAIEGAKHLEAIAVKENNSFKVIHTEGMNPPIYYLGWCHGPTGTLRLFLKLYTLTGDQHWYQLTEQCLNSIYQSTILTQRSLSLHNNGLCCGYSGVTQLFLDLYQFSGNEEYLEYSQKVLDSLSKYIFYGDEVAKITQLGHMQGCSGMALTYLHFDLAKTQGNWSVSLPDSPWNKGRYFDNQVKKVRTNRASLSAGDKLTISTIVVNNSISYSLSGDLKIYLAKKVKSSGELPKMTLDLGKATVLSIAPGKKTKLKVTLEIPASIKKGNYYLVSQFDPEGKSGDYNKANNYLVAKRKLIVK